MRIPMIIFAILASQFAVDCPDTAAQSDHKVQLLPPVKVNTGSEVYNQLVGLERALEGVANKRAIPREILVEVRGLTQWANYGSRDPAVAGSMNEEMTKWSLEQHAAHAAEQNARAAVAIEQIAELAGPELWRDMVMHYNARRLARDWRLPASVPGLREVPFSLRTSTLVDVLGISSEQRHALEDLEKSAMENLESTGRRASERIREIQKEAYQQVLQVLDERQREVYRDLYGQPLIFKDFFQSREWSDAVAMVRQSGHFISYAHKRTMRDADNTAGTGMGLDSGRTLPEAVNFLFFKIVSNPDIWDEIEATEDQRSDLKKLAEEMLMHCNLVSRDSKERFNAVLLGEYLDYGLLSDILVDRQIDWLRQIELQIWLWADRDSFGLLNDQLAKRLALDSAQRRKIEEIVQSQQKKQSEVAQEMAAEKIKTIVELAKSELGILTESQRETLANFVDFETLGQVLEQGIKQEIAPVDGGMGMGLGSD